MLETIQSILVRVLNSSLLSTFLLAVRAVTPIIALYVIWRSYTSFKKGQRRKDPVIMLEDAATGTHFPVLYWENSIGRSRSCDIQIPDESVSRDHAVLMRREEGWFVCDTGSHLGTRVRGREITEPALIEIGDKFSMGGTTLILRNADDTPKKKRNIFTGFSKEAASPFRLMLCVTLVQLSMTMQLMLGTGEFRLFPVAPFGILFLTGWALYFFSRRILKRVSFEIETVAILLSSIGILLLSGQGLDAVKTQIIAMLIGVFLFCFLVWFMSDLERVTKVRLYIAIGALLLFALNLLLGTGIGNGYLKYMPASDSDLVFGMLCEEQGLFMGLVVLAGIAMFILYARSDVTRSRSTFYAIAACATAGMLLFQTCLNVFGPTDVLPFTGVTLPFISSGGSSILSTWGLMAFLKASDERTYAAKRGGRRRPGVENSYMQMPEPVKAVRRGSAEDDTADIPVRTRGAAAGRSAQPQHRADGTNRSRRMEVHIPEEKLSPGAGRHMPRKEDDRR